MQQHSQHTTIGGSLMIEQGKVTSGEIYSLLVELPDLLVDPGAHLGQQRRVHLQYAVRCQRLVKSGHVCTNRNRSQYSSNPNPSRNYKQNRRKEGALILPSDLTAASTSARRSTLARSSTSERDRRNSLCASTRCGSCFPSSPPPSISPPSLCFRRKKMGDRGGFFFLFSERRGRSREIIFRLVC